MRTQTFITELDAVRNALYEQLKFILNQIAIHHHNQDEEQKEQFLQQRFAIEKTISKLTVIIRAEADLVLTDIIEGQHDNA